MELLKVKTLSFEVLGRLWQFQQFTWKIYLVVFCCVWVRLVPTHCHCVFVQNFLYPEVIWKVIASKVMFTNANLRFKQHLHHDSQMIIT